jgi:hypothetical protein
LCFYLLRGLLLLCLLLRRRRNRYICLRRGDTRCLVDWRPTVTTELIVRA